MTQYQRAEAMEILERRMIAAQSSMEANLRPGDREAAARERETCWILMLLLEETRKLDKKISSLGYND